MEMYILNLWSVKVIMYPGRHSRYFECEFSIHHVFLGTLRLKSFMYINVLNLLDVNIEVVRYPCSITAVVFWVGGRLLFRWENHNLLVVYH